MTKILWLSPLFENLGGEAPSLTRRTFTLVGGLLGAPIAEKQVEVGATWMGGLISAELRLILGAGAGWGSRAFSLTRGLSACWCRFLIVCLLRACLIRDCG